MDEFFNEQSWAQDPPAPAATHVDDLTPPRAPVATRPPGPAQPPAPAAPQFNWQPAATIAEPTAPAPTPEPYRDYAFASAPAAFPQADEGRRTRSQRRRGVPMWVFLVSIAATALVFGGGLGAFAFSQKQQSDARAAKIATLDKSLVAEKAATDELMAACSSTMDKAKDLVTKSQAFEDVVMRSLRDIANRRPESVIRADADAWVKAQRELKEARNALSSSSCAKAVGSGS